MQFFRSFLCVCVWLSFFFSLVYSIVLCVLFALLATILPFYIWHPPFFLFFFVSLSVRAAAVTEKGSHIGWDCGGVDKIAGSGRSLGNLGIVNLLLAVYVVGAFCIG